MGSRVFKKPEPTHIQGLCVWCGVNKQKGAGNGKFKPICSPCDKKRYVGTGKHARHYRMYVDNECHLCGFISEHPCQFDIDHKDGNHANNTLDNIWTLCANCHRLKTWLQEKARRKAREETLK